MIRKSVLVLFLLAGAAMARAQGTQTQGSLGLGPQLGFHKAKDSDDLRLMLGAALRLKFDQALGVEGSVNYREEKYRSGGVTVRSWPVMVTGLLYPIPVVYGAMGAGWYNTSIDYDVNILGSPVNISSERKQRFGWHFGGGVELPVGSSAKLVGDIRYVFLDYDFKTFPGSGNVKSDFYVITVGLLFGLQ